MKGSRYNDYPSIGEEFGAAERTLSQSVRSACNIYRKVFRAEYRSGENSPAVDHSVDDGAVLRNPNCVAWSSRAMTMAPEV